MTIYTSVNDSSSPSLIIASTRSERPRYANLFISETRNDPKKKIIWKRAQLLHIIGIPYFLSVAITYTLLTLDLRIPFPGYQFFLPTAGFMLHLGIFNHDIFFTITGVAHILFAFIVNFFDCFLINKRDYVPGIPPFVDLSWEFLNKSSEIINNSNKVALGVMIFRYIVISYMLWFLQRVHILCTEENEFNDKLDDFMERGEDGVRLNEKERSMFIRRLTFNEKACCLTRLCRVLIPQQPIINAVNHFKAVFVTCGFFIMLTIILCPK